TQERKKQEKAKSSKGGGRGHRWGYGYHGGGWRWHGRDRSHSRRAGASGQERLAFRSQILPAFPWPPPAASAIYVFPKDVFLRSSTIGEVSAAIISALERSGYTERSFYQTSGGGIAMVTRLERISMDGAPLESGLRWPTDFKTQSASLIDFLQGL